MAPKSKRGNAAPSGMVLPAILYIDEGQTAEVSLNALFSGCASFTGFPWRLRWARAEVAVLSGGQPSLVQLRLNDAKSTNVESIKSVRFLVAAEPRRRTIRMPAPNPWKEDEERSQAIVSVDNLSFGGSVTTRLVCSLSCYVEFGPLVYSTSSRLPVIESRAGTSDTSSAPSSLVMVSEQWVGRPPPEDVDDT